MLDQIAGSLEAQAPRLVPLVCEAEEKARIELERLKAEHEAWRKRPTVENERERLAKIERAASRPPRTARATSGRSWSDGSGLSRCRDSWLR